MNRTEFFTTAKITRAPLAVEQVGEEGYTLSMIVQHEGEEAQSFTLNSGKELKLFKSLGAVDKLLRENKIYSFTVTLAPEAIKAVPRKKA